MNTFAIITLIGIFLFLIASVISVNTSMGGTRSDYNDGSDFIGIISLIALFVGIIGMIVKAFI